MDCFDVFLHREKKFDFPLHFHPEYELNFIYNAEGAKRIVGDHFSTIGKYELVLTGPNLIHTWEQADCLSDSVEEITILFHRDLFQEGLLSRQAMQNLKLLLQRSLSGVAFSQGVILKVVPLIRKLNKENGFRSFIDLFELLNYLAESDNQIILSGSSVKFGDFYQSDNIKVVDEFISKHFRRKIMLEEVATLLNMTPISFIRFMKKRTGRTFVNFVNDFRIEQSAKLLIESQKSISEISYSCGFYNQANFNRIFKKKKGCPPSLFRTMFSAVTKKQ